MEFERKKYVKRSKTKEPYVSFDITFVFVKKFGKNINHISNNMKEQHHSFQTCNNYPIKKPSVIM